MLHRHRGDVAADHRRGALGVVAGGRHHMLAGDLEGLAGGDEVAALLHHLRALNDPFAIAALEPVDLDLADDLHPALAGALGHRLRHVGGVNVAVCGVIDRTLQVFGADQRPAVLDIVRRQPFERNADAFRGGGVEHVFVHPRIRLRHAQVADDGEARVQPRFLLQRLVEFDAVVVDVARRVGHVKKGEQARRVPGGPGS